MRVRSDTMTLSAPRSAGREAVSAAALRRAICRETAYALLRPALFAGEILPPRCAALLYESAAVLLHALLPDVRSRAARNVRSVLGPAARGRDAERMVRASFRAWAQSAADIPRLRTITAAELDRLVVFSGLEQLTLALGAGKGVVTTAPHLGNWEVLACALAARGFPITVVARDLYDARLSDYLIPARERWGVRTIVKGRPDTARRALAVLRRGEVLGVLGDLRTRDDSVEAPFLGRPSRFAAGPVRLALHAGAALVPMGIARSSRSTYTARILPAVIPPDGESDRVGHGVRGVADAFTRLIMETPEQWLWMHDRWPSEAPR